MLPIVVIVKIPNAPKVEVYMAQHAATRAKNHIETEFHTMASNVSGRLTAAPIVSVEHT